jgi:hypothetical protein
MYPRTTEAYKDPEFRGRPLRRGGPAVAAPVVLVGFLDLEELWVRSNSRLLFPYMVYGSRQSEIGERKGERYL